MLNKRQECLACNSSKEMIALLTRPQHLQAKMIHTKIKQKRFPDGTEEVITSPVTDTGCYAGYAGAPLSGFRDELCCLETGTLAC